MKKIAALGSLMFLMGFVGTFLGKSLEKTKLGAKIEKTLGIEPEVKKIQTSQGPDCMVQEDNDDSVLFVGCNGFF